jgi:hypothetical protein
MLLGIAIATLPLIGAMVHTHRYGSDEAPRPEPVHVVEQGPPTTLQPTLPVCAVCSSVVADLSSHSRAVHDDRAA